jgi:hypothetical protein
MRTFALACLSGVLLTLVAAPAVAQRDPFAPRADESRVAGAQQEDAGVFQPEGDAQPAEEAAEEAQPAPEQDPAPESLPVTGGEVGPWLAVAYILVALGVGTIVLARSFGPLARPRRD